MNIENGDTRMDEQRDDHSNQKRPPEKNRSEQLWTDNVPADEVKSTNGTN